MRHADEAGRSMRSTAQESQRNRASGGTIPLGPWYDTIHMTMTRLRRACRRLALAVASAQLLAFAVAPVFESIAVGPRQVSELAVVPQGSAPQAPFHDVETCVACQVMSTLACLPHSDPQPLPASAAPSHDWLTVESPLDCIQRQGFLSRAPPALPS
jgi:hypothetical protein